MTVNKASDWVIHNLGTVIANMAFSIPKLWTKSDLPIMIKMYSLVRVLNEHPPLHGFKFLINIPGVYSINACAVLILTYVSEFYVLMSQLLRLTKEPSSTKAKWTWNPSLNFFLHLEIPQSQRPKFYCHRFIIILFAGDCGSTPASYGVYFYPDYIIHHHTHVWCSITSGAVESCVRLYIRINAEKFQTRWEGALLSFYQ